MGWGKKPTKNVFKVHAHMRQVQEKQVQVRSQRMALTPRNGKEDSESRVHNHASGNAMRTKNAESFPRKKRQ